MILHFLIHGQKTEKQFATYALLQFSAPEMNSEFVVMSFDKKAKDDILYQNVRIVNPHVKEEMDSLLKSLSDYSAIILHGAFEPWCEVILRNVPESVKVAWVFWGGEIYGRQELTNAFLAPRSKMVLWIRNVLQGIRKKRVKHYEIPKSLYKRVNYCLTDMEEEYEFAKEYLDVPEMKYHRYNYYSVEETLGDLSEDCCYGGNIIIGNSASIECNFLDAFPVVRRIKRKDSSVIVPLGYGDPWVRNLVLKFGVIYFGDSFVPLIDYMPRSEYNKVLLSCSSMIQPHYRPQAQGNIITGLWLGMRVYLSERSFAYQYFKRIGVSVYSIEHDLKHGSVSCEPVDSKVLDNNRRMLKYWYGKEAMRSRILDLVSVLES